ncbi:hypothetical protein CXF85_15770 [Colwellia sp. 75C3]|uniref:hypothetical protein n=1 Tax=Colwellia sp. 75C3 TaxID=888425 RepID=UPI000C3403E5|nr:hypothetical protein [Colwellia sp. 75C3]PKG81991.1 hypothetical protein CXF85_15770 [Colwellia sp. 75C3]
MSLLEMFGYVASVLIALSLMMSNIKRLRWLNFLGAAAFSAYGYLIDAYPVFILNGWVALVDAYYLVRIYQQKDQFNLVRLKSVTSPLFNLLKDSYGKDMMQLYQKFQWQQLDDAVVLLIFRNMKPVGVFAYKELDIEGRVEVLLDYIIPENRDFKAAEFMFTGQSNPLNQEGVKHLIVQSIDNQHEHYLKRVGFIKKSQNFELVLN